MRRTQLDLDDQLWGALHARAQSEKTTVSELVRQAVRDLYLGSREQRMVAMQRVVGTRASSVEASESAKEVRRLRRGTRLDKITQR